jgi:hypothetical protein
VGCNGKDSGKKHKILFPNLARLKKKILFMLAG